MKAGSRLRCHWLSKERLLELSPAGSRPNQEGGKGTACTGKSRCRGQGEGEGKPLCGALGHTRESGEQSAPGEQPRLGLTVECLGEKLASVFR